MRLKGVFRIAKDNAVKMLFAVSMLFVPSILFAQTDDAETISADRPGVSAGTDVMPKHKIQWETGMAFDFSRNDDLIERSFNFNNSLFRYGLLSFLELRMELNGYYQHLADDNHVGLGPVNLGTKIKLYESNNWIPNISLLASFDLPIGSEWLKPTHVAPSVHALFSNDLSSRLNLGYDVGLDWDGEQSTPDVFAGVCLGYSLNESVSFFIESYNYFYHNSSDDYGADLGVSWLVSNKVQLDVSGGLSLNHFGDFYNVGIGVSWLIN